ncbi:hypothetical protein BDAP_002377 [Binucleata daphniae]
MQIKINTFLEINPIGLGSPGVKVQNDETKFNFIVKSHKGRGPTTPIWAITNSDCSTTPAKGYGGIVPFRNAANLLLIVDKIALLGSI